MKNTLNILVVVLYVTLFGLLFSISSLGFIGHSSFQNPLVNESSPSGCSGYKGVALSVGASNGTYSYVLATKYVHSGGNCDVNRMAIYCRSTGMVAANVKLAIYSDSSGPNAPLAYTGAIAVTSDNWTADTALSGTVSLVDSTVYWLAFQGDDVFSYKYDTGSAGDAHYDTDGSYATFPQNPFGSDGTLDRLVSIRMSYVP